MTKKDYEKIAKLFKIMPIVEMSSKSGTMVFPWYHATALIDSFCDMFQEDNPKFDKEKFLKACDFEPWDKVIMGIPKYKK